MNEVLLTNEDLQNIYAVLNTVAEAENLDTAKVLSRVANKIAKVLNQNTDAKLVPTLLDTTGKEVIF